MLFIQCLVAGYSCTTTDAGGVVFVVAKTVDQTLVAEHSGRLVSFVEGGQALAIRTAELELDDQFVLPRESD